MVVVVNTSVESGESGAGTACPCPDAKTISCKKMILRIIGGTVGIASVLIGFYFSSYLISKCHLVYQDTISHLGTKTPYLFNGKVVANMPNTECSAEQVWMIVRHGTRLPGAEIITKIKTELPALRDAIVKNHEEGRGSLCSESLETIKSWKPHYGFKESEEKWLVPQGEIEIEGIAKRYKERFPQLFGIPYKKDSFLFKYTQTQRAEASAKLFAKGLLEDNHKDVSYPPAVKADPILRVGFISAAWDYYVMSFMNWSKKFYKSCAKWQQDVDDNPEAYKERDLFEKTDLFLSALESIRQRLGFQRNLTVEETELMYIACAFETAWQPNKTSEWCSVFDENDFLLFEYRSDVKYYWIDGYGFELTYKHACAPVNDVLESFQKRINQSPNSPQVIAYFTHSGTLLKLISRFGLFKDDTPLLSNNYHLHSKRLWRTSKIDKFATNLAFVLFKCGTEYKVGTYFQEELVFLPACEDYFCSFDKFQSNLVKTIDTCDVENLCKV